MHQPNFHTLSLSFSLSLSLVLSLFLHAPHLCIYVAMRSSLPTIHAIMWCFWPSAICLSISSCIPRVHYLSIYLSICCFFLSFCLTVCLSFFLSIYISIYLPTDLSIYRSIYLSLSISYLCIYESISLSIYRSKWLISRSTHNLYLSASPLSVCLSILSFFLPSTYL